MRITDRTEYQEIVEARNQLMERLRTLEVERALNIDTVRDLNERINEYDRRIGQDQELAVVDSAGSTRHLLVPTETWGEITEWLAARGLQLGILGESGVIAGPVYVVTPAR